MMAFIPHGKLTEHDLLAFEKRIGFNLPEDYRQFLIENNGGVFSDEFVVDDKIGRVALNVLFGLGLRDEFSLSFWYDEMEGEIPDNSVLIGVDPGGAFLLLSMEPELAGVYFYDHAYRLPTSSDEENTYYLGATFSDLMRRKN